MGTTPNYNIQYPDSGDQWDLINDLQTLADTTDAAIQSLADTTDAAIDGVEAASQNASNLTSGTVDAARLPNLQDMNGTLDVANGGTGGTTLAQAQGNLGVGIVPVTPSTVVVSGGSATTNADGSVSVTTVSTVSLNNIFSADYNVYEFIIADAVSASTINDPLDIRLRNSGTDRITDYYQNGVQQTAAVTPGIWSTNNTSYFQLNSFNTTAGTTFANFKIFYPFATARTQMSSVAFGYGSSLLYTSITGIHNLAQSHDGLTIRARAGNFSGTIQVFAYNR